MTEEEKEKARLEQMALQQEQWDIEEQQLVEEVNIRQLHVGLGY